MARGMASILSGESKGSPNRVGEPCIAYVLDVVAARARASGHDAAKPWAADGYPHQRVYAIGSRMWLSAWPMALRRVLATVRLMCAHLRVKVWRVRTGM